MQHIQLHITVRVSYMYSHHSMCLVIEYYSTYFGWSKNRYQDTPAAHHYQSMEALKHPRLAYLNLGTAEMNQVF